MVSRVASKAAQEFRILLVSGGAVASEEVIRSSDEADAFMVAERMTMEAAARGVSAASAYVLDQNLVFRGSVDPASLPMQLAA